MTKYRKKPVEVEAMQVPARDDVDAWSALTRWCDAVSLLDIEDCEDVGVGELWVAANSRYLPIEPGEWVLRDPLGFYPCKAEVFAATYEDASEPRFTIEVYSTVHYAHEDDTPGSMTDHRWRARARNGEVLASGEGYTRSAARDEAVALLWPGVTTVEVDG